METYTPANNVNKDTIVSPETENHEVKILRESNKNFKLEIIDLKLKLKEIYSALTANTDNLIHQ